MVLRTLLPCLVRRLCRQLGMVYNLVLFSEASADEFVYSSVDIQEEEGEEFKKFSDCCDWKKGKHW